MLFSSIAFVTFFIQSHNLAVAQGQSGFFGPPGSPSNPQNQPSGGFAGFWTALGGGQGCGGCGGGCGGACGGGSSINIVNNINVNYPGADPNDPVTPSTPSTTTTSASYCQVSVYYGPYRPAGCGVASFLAATTYGYCEPGRLSFQLSGMPCAYSQGDGTVVFDPQGMGCGVGPGIVYYGSLIVTDNWTGQQLANSQIMLDTTDMDIAYCGTTTSTPPPTCSVSYFIPNGGIYYATECNQVILSPPYISGCGDGQIRYELSGAIYCLNMFPNNGSVVIDLSPEHDIMGGCRVGPFSSNYGTVTAFDAYTGYPGVVIGSWTIVVDLNQLEYCRPTTTAATTTTEASTTTTVIPG